MTGKEMAIGTSFVVGAVAFVALIAFSVASLPAVGALDVPSGTVFRAPQVFLFSVGPKAGQLVGAWTSDAPVGTLVDWANNPVRDPNAGIGGKVIFAESGQLNLSLGPGSYGLFYLGNATVTVTRTIGIVNTQMPSSGVT